MTFEDSVLNEGRREALLNDFFADELERAGYHDFSVQETPSATEIVLTVDKPGMVIGKGGQNIRELTSVIEERFDFDEVQIDVQEIENPDLSASIVADRLANALERGWYFRDAGQTTLQRIMDEGAQGVEITLRGKLTGARSRTERFKAGYIKYNGQPAQDVVEAGQSEAVMQLGTIGVTVRIIPPEAELPDNFVVHEGVDVEAEVDDGSIEALLEETEE